MESNCDVRFERRPSRRCIVDSVCGSDLESGIHLVCFVTMIIAILSLISSVILIAIITGKDQPFSSHPLHAVKLLLLLVLGPMSLYQLIVTVLLLYQAMAMNGNPFICSVWFSSHIHILVIYAILFGGKIVIDFCYRNYLIGVSTLLAIILYEVLFIYFIMVVKSYMVSLNIPRYY